MFPFSPMNPYWWYLVIIFILGSLTRGRGGVTKDRLCKQSLYIRCDFGSHARTIRLTIRKQSNLTSVEVENYLCWHVFHRGTKLGVTAARVDNGIYSNHDYLHFIAFSFGQGVVRNERKISEVTFEEILDCLNRFILIFWYGDTSFLYSMTDYW